MEEAEIGQFKVTQYLSSSQIEIVKGRMATPERNALIDLIDGFIQSNGSSTPEYEKLVAVSKSIGEAIIYMQGKSEEIIKSLHFLYELSLTNIFVLTGIITQEDMDRAKEELQKSIAEKSGYLPGGNSGGGNNEA